MTVLRSTPCVLALLLTPWPLSAACPDDVLQTEDAHVGWSVAISSDGSTALIGCQGYDEGDGLTRVFHRVGGEWAEQPSLSPIFAGGFGWSVALSGEGDTAVVGAPLAIGFPFTLGQGKAYVYERDGSGTWSESAAIEFPRTLNDANFGNAVAISGDGDTIVIGQTYQAWAGINSQQDSAWVLTRDGQGWSAPMELVVPGAQDSWGVGSSVAISPDAGWIAVGAPGQLQQNQGRVAVFQRVGGAYAHTQTIAHVPANGLNYFGASVSLTDDALVVGDPFNDEDQAGAERTNAGAVFVYAVDGGGQWAPAQGPIFAPGSPASAQFGAAVSARGDHMLVGAPDLDGSGGVFALKRAGGQWAATGSATPEDPMFGADYGAAVAIDGSGTEWVIGEPWAEFDNDFFYDGRAYFASGVIETMPYSFVPSGTSFDIELVFPGFKKFGLTVELVGQIILELTGCEVDLTRATVSGLSMIPSEQPIVVPLRLMPDLVFSGLEVTLTKAGPPATVAPDGTAQLVGYEVVLSGFVSMGKGGAKMPIALPAEVPLVELVVVDAGGGPPGVSFSVPAASTEAWDLGLGSDNPTATITGTGALEPARPPACDADLTADGQTDSGDLNALLADFGCVGGCDADLDADGDTDSADLNVLLADFGCGLSSP